MHQFLTTISPAPACFELVQLTKRHLLSGPVCILTEDGQLAQLLESYKQRMLGVVITIGPEYRLEQQTPFLWHAVLPSAWLEYAASLAQGWLGAITSADHANQQFNAAEIRNERLARELDFTRRDYNELTQRMQAQLRELATAKDALGALNNQLEQRVAERTTQLEMANQNLSLVVHDLRRTQDELARTAELVGLGSLVAGVAHELNTPLGTSLMVATSLAAETKLLHQRYQDGVLKRSAVESYLQAAEQMNPVLERNIRHAADIVDRLRQLTSYQTSEARCTFTLNEIVARTVTYGESQLRDTPYRIVVESTASIEMDSYPDAIAQILISLINNALTHGFEGRGNGAITIRFALDVTQDQDRVNISFNDDGQGISKENLARIFHPFFSTKFGQGGSGLGLYVAYNKAQKLLGGRLSVSSEWGHGACFVLSIPRIAPLMHVGDFPNASV